MYYVKQNGRNGFARYRTGMGASEHPAHEND
jgi:hypothetical protein